VAAKHDLPLVVGTADRRPAGIGRSRRSMAETDPGSNRPVIGSDT